METVSGNVWIEGPRVRGEKEGDVSDIWAMGAMTSGEAEADSEYEYTDEEGRWGVRCVESIPPSGWNSGEVGDGGTVWCGPAVLRSEIHRSR